LGMGVVVVVVRVAVGGGGGGRPGKEGGREESGVGEGEVLSLLRSLRVMWGRDWESRAASSCFDTLVN
jgi:hypothetical protein